MLQETMAKVKKSEDQAQQIVADSEAEAREIVEKAKKEASDMKQNLLAEGKENTQQLAQDEKVLREKEIALSLSVADEEINGLKTQVQQKESAAVDLIISLLT